MNIKLVAADLDNTIAPTGKAWCDLNKRALRELHARGIPFVLASGKTVHMLKHTEKKNDLGHEIPFIMGMNGSQLLDRIYGREYEFELLSSETLKEIWEMMEPFGLNPYVYYEDGMLIEKIDGDLLASCKRNDLKSYLVKDKGPVWARPTAKILYRMKEEMMPVVREFVSRHPSEKWLTVQSQKTMLEFIHPETSKGHTLLRICQMHEISPVEVMAFGDSENDEEMLKCCHGICLKDGFEKTKRVCEDVTDLNCDEGGFGDYLFKHVLT